MERERAEGNRGLAQCGDGWEKGVVPCLGANQASRLTPSPTNLGHTQRGNFGGKRPQRRGAGASGTPETPPGPDQHSGAPPIPPAQTAAHTTAPPTSQKPDPPPQPPPATPSPPPQRVRPRFATRGTWRNGSKMRSGLIRARRTPSRHPLTQGTRAGERDAPTGLQTRRARPRGKIIYPLPKNAACRACGRVLCKRHGKRQVSVIVNVR